MRDGRSRAIGRLMQMLLSKSSRMAAVVGQQRRQRVPGRRRVCEFAFPFSCNGGLQQLQLHLRLSSRS